MLQYEEREIHILFIDFMMRSLLFAFAEDFSFARTTCLFEISYTLYRRSFEERLTSEKSFELLKKILVRHSLFRPPISILVFDLA